MTREENQIVTSSWCFCLILIVVYWISVPSAFSQTSVAALFLETIRDPGRLDLPPTARMLSLGGVHSGFGSADEAATYAASLMLTSGADFVASAGSFSYGRDELVNTPDQFPPLHPERRDSASAATPLTYAAFARRWPTWAVAAFYDNTTRFEQSFETAKSTIYFAALQGSFVHNEGTGSASISQVVTRVGGALALKPTQRVSIGVSLYALRLDYDVSSHVHIDSTSSFAGGPIGHSTSEDDQSVSFLGWGNFIFRQRFR